MVTALFFVNVIGAFVVLLSTSMLQNHFRKIEHSMEVYNNAKCYKPESQISFLIKVIERYKEVRAVEADMMNVEAMITNTLYEEKIGHFSFLKVYSIATKGKVLLWGVLVGQVVIELIINNGSGTLADFSFIIANTILCMVITLAQIMKAIADKKEHLIVKINDYIINIDPAEKALKEKNNKIKELMGRLEQLEQDQLQEKKMEKTGSSLEDVFNGKQDSLKAQDIADLISNLNIE